MLGILLRTHIIPFDMVRLAKEVFVNLMENVCVSKYLIMEG